MKVAIIEAGTDPLNPNSYPINSLHWCLFIPTISLAFVFSDIITILRFKPIRSKK